MGCPYFRSVRYLGLSRVKGKGKDYFTAATFLLRRLVAAIAVRRGMIWIATQPYNLDKGHWTIGVSTDCVSCSFQYAALEPEVSAPSKHLNGGCPSVPFSFWNDASLTWGQLPYVTTWVEVWWHCWLVARGLSPSGDQCNSITCPFWCQWCN